MTLVKHASELPGDTGLPIMGNSIKVVKTHQIYYWQSYQRYGSAFKTKVLGKKVAVLVGANANQAVLKDQAEKFSSEAGWFYLKPLLKDGLLLQDGKRHARTKKIISPAFHREAIAGYIETIQQVASTHIQSWGNETSLDLARELRRMTLKIACHIILGVQSSSQIEELRPHFSKFYRGVGAIPINLSFNKFGQAKRAQKTLTTYILNLIQERRQSGRKAKQLNVMDLLLASTDQNGRPLSNEEILIELQQLLFGGHETITSFLCWSLFELAANPHWLGILRQELEVVVGDRPLDISHLGQMEQMNLVLKEIERLYPPVYVIPRGVVEDFEFGGYRIPAGWYVNLSPFLSHRMAETYTSPDLFDPNRFAPPREEHKKHPFALIGFGAGLHRCMGYELAQMEIKIILSMFIQNFTWHITPNRATTAPVYFLKEVERIMRANFARIG